MKNRRYLTTKAPTREAYERAQCRAEDYLGDAPDFRDQVREIMQILAQPPRANIVDINGERRVV